MADLQATWLSSGDLFLWAANGDLARSLPREAPSLRRAALAPASETLALQGTPLRRRSVDGVRIDLATALPALAALDTRWLAPSLACFAIGARLAIELGARQRVVPTVDGDEARWRVLITTQEDRDRFESLVRSLPTIARANPTKDRGQIRLRDPESVMRGFLDRCVDAVYRQGVYPGSARGWELAFANALRAEETMFRPRDARFQGVPGLLELWSKNAEAAGLRIELELGLPRDEGGQFPLRISAVSDRGHGDRVPVSDAWRAGDELVLGGIAHQHPAYSVLRGLARAARLFAPLDKTLEGPEPHDVSWTAAEAWHFLSSGMPALRAAGFPVRVPDEIAPAGARRIRARLCVEAPDSAHIGLSDLLRVRWEVVLGDEVIDGDTFSTLTRSGEPLVWFRDRWVVLDPGDVGRLPDGLPRSSTLGAAQALRAILTGEHDGVPVVADDRLALLLAAIREPPERPVPPGFEGTLRPYQRKGLAWLSALGDLGLGACLADDMGLGKTVQVAAYLLARRERGPALVVCPTSVLGNWQHELARFTPALRVVRHHGADRDTDELTDADVIVTSYGLMVRDEEAFVGVEWDLVILDEAQAIKNPQSRRAEVARLLRARQRLALTGTPIENRLDELWSIFTFLLPSYLGPRARFQREIAVPIERFADQDVAATLRRSIGPFLLRRLKTDPTVIADLPDKIERRDFTLLTAEQAALYEEVVEEAFTALADSTDMTRRGRVLAMLTALKQVCNHPAQYLDDGGPLVGRSGKLERCLDLLDLILDGDERALVFTQYRVMGSLLVKAFERELGVEVAFLHGGTPALAREEMVRAFQEDDDGPDILIVSLRAGGTGLNLTRATHVIHYDRWWNPAVEDQATDRAYRIGQTGTVQVHKLVCQGTLEERIDRMLDEKRELAKTVIGKGERWVTELDDDALRHLVSLAADAVGEG